MLPAALGGPIDGFLAAVRREAGDQVAAVYAVGALALDDFSVKQSNIDLVVVAHPSLTAAQLGRLRRAERGLERVGRPAGLWYTSWEEVADEHGPGVAAGDRLANPATPSRPSAPAGGPSPPAAAVPSSPAAVTPTPPVATPPIVTPPVATPTPMATPEPASPGPGSARSGQPPPGFDKSAPGSLATPMTRALLRQDPVALMGPDWPVVGYDEAAFRAWCADRLRTLVTTRKGLLVLRRAVTPLVLEASRLAQGAITGRVFSKSEAGESIGMIVAPRYRRILTDAVGYRRGAQTSMYWGPFERKYDALVLLRDLLDVATTR
jgi:hypothetical protein